MSPKTGHNQNGLAYALSRKTKYGIACKYRPQATAIAYHEGQVE
jgi:hypothetical protein